MGKIAGKEESVQRLPAEQLYQEEIDALIAAEQDPVPTGWRMSPRSVLTYITGGTVGGKEITPKYIGNRRLVEIAIATLVTDRAPAPDRGAGNRKVLAVRAPDRSHQRGFHQGDTGNRRHHGGAHTLFMELRHAHSPGAVQGGYDKKPCIPRHGDRQHCPF